MNVSDKDPLQEFSATNVKRITGYTLLGSCLSIPAILIVFFFVGMVFYVFLDFELSISTALDAIFIYSCIAVPIAIIIISLILLKRKEKNFRKVLQLSWAGLIGTGALLAVISSAIGGGEWLITTLDAPAISATEQMETAIAHVQLSFEQTAAAQVTATLPPTSTSTPTVSNTPTITPTATETLTPSMTPIPSVNIYAIYENYQDMTELQFNGYSQSIQSKPVRQKVEIGNVSDNGVLILNGPWAPWLINITDFCVIVTGVPYEVALGLDGGDEVFLEANINRIVGNYNYYWNCENTLVLVYNQLYNPFE